MQKQVVLVTRKIPNVSPLTTEPELEVFMGQERPPTREELLTGLKGVDGVLALLTEKIDAEAMDAAGDNLKIIANYAVGHDNVDLDAATSRGIIVTNTPGQVEAVAEHALAMVMALGKNLVASDHFVKEKKYEYWDPNIFLSPYFQNKTLGVIGTGRIGSHMVELCYPLFKEIIYFDIKSNADIENRYGAKKVSIENLMRQSDFISVHTVLNESTHHLIDSKMLALMKKTAYIVNTSRGPVIEEKALVDALTSGQISGAGLDVFENEPQVSEELMDLENVILTPHVASATDASRAEMSDLAIGAVLEALLEGKVPANIINKEVIGKTRLKEVHKENASVKLHTSIL